MPSAKTLLATNVAIGALTTGVSRLIRGERVWPALITGAIGGAGVYAGKRMIANEGAANAWAGRQIAAVGASVVRNVSSGTSILSELTLPIGPTRVSVHTSPFRVSPRLDLASTISAIVFAARPGTSIDLRESLSNGALIFTQPLTTINNPGSHSAGVLRIDDIPPNRKRFGDVFIRSAVTAHELIHASQYDFAAIAWGTPIERTALRRFKVASKVQRYVDLGLVAPVWMAANSVIEHDVRPWEREAISLAPGG